MFGRLIKSIIVLILMGSLLGCFSTKQSFTRDTLKNEGLVVAEIFRLNTDGNVYSVSGVPRFESGSVPYSIQHGHMVVALPPGKHTLQTLYTVSGSLSTTYSFNLEFDVSASSVTNLGKLILLMEDKLGSSRYRIISVENDSYMLSYLRTSYADAFGSIAGKFIKPKFNQLAAKNMDKFQMEIARRKMMMGQNTIQLDARNYIVYGGLGTLVRFTMSKDLKKFTKVQSLNASTLDPLLSCDSHKKTIACLTYSETAARILIVKGNKVSSQKLNNTSFSKLFFERNGGIVLINNQFEIMRSKDLAVSWELDKRFYRAEKSSYALDITQGLDGFFLYMKKQDAPVLKYNRKTARFSKLDIPFGSEYLTAILETRNGIYIGPEFTLMSNAKIYYQENLKSSWQEIEIPYSSCTSLKSLDKGKGRHLQLNCSSALKVESKDGGKSWYPAG
ncbi:MAG: hypothetical protein OQL09_06730 [Gammaproteobacteria bacterium]|nr:hypothetical protein [Gammaproteobacteria bacterium]